MKFIYILVYAFFSCISSSHDAKAFKVKTLACQFHNSKKCENPTTFLSEKEMGCAKLSGNCRHVFCKKNCMTKSPLSKYKYKLCKEQCFHPVPLSRFNRQIRNQFYRNLDTDKKTLNSLRYTTLALETEETIHMIKSKDWWSLGRQPNMAVYNELKALYLDRLQKMYAKLEADKNRKKKPGSQTSEDAFLKEKIAQTQKEFSEILEDSSNVTDKNEELQKKIAAKQADMDLENSTPVPVGTFKILEKNSKGILGKFLSPIRIDDKDYVYVVIHTDNMKNVDIYRSVFVSQTHRARSKKSMESLLFNFKKLPDTEAVPTFKNTLLSIRIKS